MLKVRVKELGDIVVFHLKGEVVVLNLHQIKTPFEEKLAQDKRLFIFNLELVTYMDSAAIGMFYTKLVLLKKEGGTVELIKPNSNIKRIIESTKLVDLVSIYDNENDAVDALK
jgi:anti-anti-sigma factor